MVRMHLHPEVRKVKPPGSPVKRGERTLRPELPQFLILEREADPTVTVFRFACIGMCANRESDV